MQKLIYTATISILFILLSTIQVNAQGWRSTASEDTGRCEFRTAVTQTTDGGYMAAGLYKDSLLQLNHLRIHKFDADGVELWNKDLSDTSSIVVGDIISCSDGNYLIAGEKVISPFISYGFALKVDNFGNVLWKYEEQTTSYKIQFNRVIESASGSYLLTGRTDTLNDSKVYLVKLDNAGVKEWEGVSIQTGEGNDLVENPDQSITVAGDKRLSKFDPYGNIIWAHSPLPGQEIKAIELSNYRYTILSKSTIAKIGLNGAFLGSTPTSASFQSVEDLKLTSDGIVYIGRTTPNSWSDNNTGLVIKTDSIGNEIWRRVISKNRILHRLLITANDEIVCSGLGVEADKIQVFNGSNFSVEFHLNCSTNFCNNGICYDACNGSLPVQAITYDTVPSGIPPFSYLWSNWNTTPSNIYLCQDSTYFLTITDAIGTNFIAELNTPTIRSGRLELVKLDENGLIFNNIISGNVYRDNDKDCAFDTGEPGFKQLIVYIDGDDQFATLTDQNGGYSIDVDSGSYNITTSLPNPLFEKCAPYTSFMVNELDSVAIDMPIKSLEDCPYMTVVMNSTTIRRCSTSYFHINYCNDGTIDANNVYVEVTLDTALTLVSTSIPWSSQSGNTFTFQLGTMPFNTCSSFSMFATASCYITQGQTISNNVHIYPDTMCFPPFTTWDGSVTDLQVDCQQDSVTFTIKNIGAGAMSGPLNYIVAEDNIILKTDNFQLTPNQTKLVKLPTNGSTYRMYADQSPGYFPTGYVPTAFMEGCGTNTSGNFSVGFVNDFPTTDNLHYKYDFNKEVVGPYDPNDKAATPEGVGVEHIIEQNIDLEYYIRFQNIGTDTAFNVVIRDTLSEHLDITTLQQGAGSHPYRLDIVGNNILKFTFPNIQLVDSITNEPGSHGFVSFKISQLDSLPLGTMIYNSAAIYFDYEVPVITNQTYHEVGEFFIDIEMSTEQTTTQAIHDVKVFPNPFNEYADIVLMHPSKEVKSLSVCDAMGRVVLTAPLENNSYRIHKNQLPAGVYFFTISDQQQLIKSGKVIIK